MIIISTKFPKKKKDYAKAGEDNTDRLLKTMEKLILSEQNGEQAKSSESWRGEGREDAWSYQERKKRGKPKTFKLV